MKPFKTIGVVGAGTMGQGIAQLFVTHGFTTCLYDVNADALLKATDAIRQALIRLIEKGKLPAETLTRFETCFNTTDSLSALAEKVDLVIEAAPEDLALKQDLFRQLDKLTPPETVLLSNTSSLSITALASATQRPAQVAGLHFFNPVSHMPLVEIIQGAATPPALIDPLMTLAKQLGKTPVVVQDTPGFIVNRVARPFYGEALRMLGEGVGNVETLDTVLKTVGGFKMGPFELMDLIGIDINLAVTQSLYEASFHEARYRPHPIQARMVAVGRLGRKTGQGFYTHE